VQIGLQRKSRHDLKSGVLGATRQEDSRMAAYVCLRELVKNGDPASKGGR
jgi:hypothetical protein